MFVVKKKLQTIFLEIRDERRDNKQDVWCACERQDGKRVVDEGIVLA